MAKRKRAHGQSKPQAGDADYDPSASKLKFNSYAEIADSEDEFHINGDKILLGSSPDVKRRKQFEDDVIEASDEEVLGYGNSASDDEAQASDGEEDEAEASHEDTDAESNGSRDPEGEEDEDEITGWGSSKADYYNADVIETEQDALEEEAEARRLQQKRLQALKEADFGFDENEWLDAGKDYQDEAEAADGLVTEVLPQVQITEDMGPAERLKLLKTRYPEFEPLANQLVELQPLHAELANTAQAARKEQKIAIGGKSASATPVPVMKYRALSSYLGALAMYFAILTSTAKDEEAKSLPLAPYQLQHHDIMDSLVRCREVWEQVKHLTAPISQADTTDVHTEDLAKPIPRAEKRAATEYESIKSAHKLSKIKTKPQPDTAATATVASLARRAERLRRAEESIANLSTLTSTSTTRQPAQNPATTTQPSTNAAGADSDNDLGDEPSLAPYEAAEKARRKKSLRFYTSQIAQRANKRADAGRAAGGDDDLPYRERFRDRQERLTREAERRGKKAGKDDTELRGEGDSGGEGEVEITNRERWMEGNGEEFATELEARVRAKKARKVAREEAYVRAAEEGGRVVPHPVAVVGPDGRREVGYAIEKNKGLMPRRKKDVKNPRVKKRKKFEEKSKKLRSMKATYKGGEGRGGYAGELTGIKKGLIRSVKL